MSTGAQGSTVTLLISGTKLAGATLNVTPPTGITVSNLQSLDSSIAATLTIASSAPQGQRQITATVGAETSNALAFTVTQNANSAPVITSMSMTPAFGIAFLTSFNYAASATDPDGDPVAYSWNIAGNSASGPAGQIVFSTGGNGVATVTVTDGRGGSANSSRTFTVGSMTGTWDGTNSTLGPFVMTLTQTGGSVSGTYSDTSPFGQGRTDPAQPGTISPAGAIELRIKQGAFTDFTFRGTMATTGRLITGGIFGSGFTGQPFTMTKR